MFHISKTTDKKGIAVSLKKTYQEMIKVNGMSDTATLMEMSESSVDNRVYERQGQEFRVRQALRLQQISKTTLFAEKIAELSGGTFVKLPLVDDVDNDSLLAKFNQLHAELGELSREFAAATADGEVDERERRRLEAIADDIHRTMQELLALTFRVYCREDVRGGR